MIVQSNKHRQNKWMWWEYSFISKNYFFCHHRGSLSDPFHEWGPAAYPGRPGALPAAPPDPVLHWGTLCDLLRQGTVLSLQHQRQAAGTHGSGGQRQGEEMSAGAYMCEPAHVCVCTTSVQKVLSLIKGSVLVGDLSKVQGRRASGQKCPPHTPDERFFWSRAQLSGQISAVLENIPEEWSVLDTDTINYPPVQDDTFPISHISSLVVGVIQDSGYCLWFPDPLFGLGNVS